MIRAKIRSPNGKMISGSRNLADQWDRSIEGRLWLDIESEISEEVRQLLQGFEAEQLTRPGLLAMQMLPYAYGRYLDTLLQFEDRLFDLEDLMSAEQILDQLQLSRFLTQSFPDAPGPRVRGYAVGYDAKGNSTDHHMCKYGLAAQLCIRDNDVKDDTRQPPGTTP